MESHYAVCFRTARIALVAAGTHKRYILATQNMKVGDIIRSYNHQFQQTGMWGHVA